MDFFKSVLVASPYLTDNNFSQSVILLVQESPDEIMGLILNRPSNKKIKDVWKDLFGKECSRNDSLFIGGPVAGPLIAIHTNHLYSESELFSNIYLSMQKETIEYLVENEKGPLKVFLGYTGWNRQQFYQEIDNGLWYLLPNLLIDPFDGNSDSWEIALQQSTDISILNMLKLQKFPENTLDN